MVPHLIRPKAQDDLKDIADFSFEKWGKVQEESYLRMLQISFNSISDNPYIGRAIDDIVPGLRRLLAGRHIILYFINETHIDIVRVLHHSMDIFLHIDALENGTLWEV
jgi:toxin ParE1/3/4